MRLATIPPRQQRRRVWTAPSWQGQSGPRLATDRSQACRCGSGPGHRSALDGGRHVWGYPDRPPLRLCLNAPFAPEHAARIAIALPSDIPGFSPSALERYELDVKPRDLGNDQKPQVGDAGLRGAYGLTNAGLFPEALVYQFGNRLSTHHAVELQKCAPSVASTGEPTP
jgi:hypothetical protein